MSKKGKKKKLCIDMEPLELDPGLELTLKDPDLPLEGVGELQLEGFDVDLELLPPSDGYLLKIIKDIQELGNISKINPEEVLVKLKEHWKGK